MHGEDNRPEAPAPALSRAALRIADELRLEPRRERTAKISSLLHTFRSPGVHCEVEDMIQALVGAGVRVQSHDSRISRRDVIDLRLDETVDASPSDEGPVVRVSFWRDGEPGEPVALSGTGDLGASDNAVIWFDIDAPDGEPTIDAVNMISGLLSPWCPELNQVIVRDLLTPDVQPKSETYGDERTGIRTISVPALVAREIPDDDDDFDGVDEQLILQMVELAVGQGWIITCWHPSRTLVGGGVVRDGPSLLREPFVDHVRHRWLNDAPDLVDSSPRAKEAGDLAIYLARSLVATYGASLRMLQRWVSSWEVEFYQTIGDQDRHGSGSRASLRAAAFEISNFLAVVGEFSRSVNAFKLAGDEMPNETWFADPGPSSTTGSAPRERGEQAKALAASVDAAAEKLVQLYDEIRADMDLLMIQSQARQQEASERLQGYLGKVTGLILVPTFVAGLFGANTALPGQGSWMGFELMVALMVLSAAVSYWVIRKLLA